MRFFEFIVKIIKGFVIGASMLIPGVSGGTMAIILGIYDQLIEAVSRIKQNFKNNSILLIQYAAGGLLGITLLSGPLLEFVTKWSVQSMSFFMGAIIASVPPLYRRARADKLKVRNIFVVLLGAAIGLSLMFLPSDLLVFDDYKSVAAMITLFIVGLIVAVALVLPGISASYMLLIFGLYDITLKAWGDFYLPYLVPLALGICLGVFGTAKILDKLMMKHPQFTYMMIIGFLLGSLVQVYQGIPSESSFSITAVLAFVVGIVIITFLVAGGNVSKKKRSEQL